MTPAAGADDLALFVTSVDWPCISKYIDFDADPDLAALGIGRLVDTPVFRTPAEWGTVHMSDLEIVPSSSYSVASDFGGGIVSSSATDVTWLWGDTDHVGLVITFDDIVCALDGFAGLYFGGCSFFGADLMNALTDGVIDFDDVIAVLEAFAGADYFDNPGTVEPCVGP